VIVSLGRDADLHMAQQIPLPFTVSCFIKIQIGFTFWYRLTLLTRVVPDEGSLKGVVVVVVVVVICLSSSSLKA